MTPAAITDTDAGRPTRERALLCAAALCALWLMLINLLTEYTWRFGPSTFLGLLCAASLVAFAAFAARRGLRRWPVLPFVARVLPLLLAAVVLFFAVAHGARFADQAGRRTEHVSDVADNTNCASLRLFTRGENPYAHPCQRLSVRKDPGAAVDANGAVTLYGLSYRNGYSYFPAMFLSYAPFRAFDPSGHSVRFGNLFFLAAALVLLGALTASSVPRGQRFAAVSLAAFALLGMSAIGFELFKLAVTDIVIGVYALCGLLALQRQRPLVGGAFFGLALACKLLPGAFFVVLALAYCWRRPGRWRFAAALAGVSAAVVLPFLLWDPERFLSSTVLFYLSHHGSGDSTALFTFLPEWLRTPYTLAGAALTLALLARFVVRPAQSVVGLAASCVVVQLLFVATSRMSHFNYVWPVIPLACFVLAAGPLAPRPHHPRRPRPIGEETAIFQ